MSLFGSSSGKQPLIPPISPPSFLRIDRQIYTTSSIHPSITFNTPKFELTSPFI